MLEKLIDAFDPGRWFVLVAVTGARRSGRLELPAPADRRDAGHHQCPGADQHGGAGLFAARGGAAPDVSDRNGDRRSARACLHPFDLALRLVAGDGRLHRQTDIYFARQLLNERLRRRRRCRRESRPISDRSPRVWARSSSIRSSLRRARANRTARNGLSRTCACSRTGSSGRSFARRPASPM